MTSKKIISCILVASLLTGTIPVNMFASAADTPTTVTITPGTDEAKTGTGSMTITLKIKQDITPTVSLTGWTYGGTANTPSVTGNDGNDAVTYQYKLKTADDTAYSATVPTAAGEYTVKAVIAETDEYKAGEATANFTIAKATPAPDAVTGLTADYGKTLADVKLPTGWAWDDALTTSVGDAGNNTFSATFTPDDTDNYNTYTTDLTVTVTAIPATPGAVAALNATYGQTLADVKLPTVEDGSGTWAWKDAATTPVGNAGEQTFKAVFTPSSANYSAVEQEVTINVAKADPNPEPFDVITATYGSTLADIKLPTGWAWKDDTLSVGDVGKKTFGATYTPSDRNNYNVIEGGVQINVVAVDKAALNEAVTAADTYLATIQKTVYADPALALSFAITDAKGVAENDNVTEEQVAQAITDVNNAVTIAKAAVKDIDDTKAAQAVTDQINALPAAADIVSADKTAVDAARAAYNALVSPDQTGKVTEATLAKLTTAEKAVADHIAADAVIAKIDEIGTVALTDESKALIDAARAAYDALSTEDQKALVSNYTTLTADEQEYSNLQVADVEAKINAIGKVELTDAIKEKIDTARTAYDALSPDQQALVRNAIALGYAEDLYEALEDKKTAEDEKAAAEAAKAQAEADAAKAVAAAQAAQKAAEDAQAAAEKSASDAKASQTKAEEEAAAAKTAQAEAEAAQKAAEDALAKGEADAAEKVAAAEAAQKAAEEAQTAAEKSASDAKAAQAKAEAEAAAAKTAQAEAEAAQKAAEDALAKAESDAAAKIAAAQAAQKAAEDAQAAAEKSAQEAADKAAAAETAKKAAEDALAKGEADAAEKVAAAEAAQKAAEEAQAKADADKAIADQAAQDAAEAQEEAEAAADQAAADKVIKKIDAIGEVKNNNSCENDILSARSAYDTLTDAQQALVTNYNVLTAAESEYETISKYYAPVERLCEMAIKDYEVQNGTTPANAEAEKNADGTLSIQLTDENGKVLDTYTIDPVTATGIDTDKTNVNLPQTGVTSKSTAAAVGGALAMIAAGFWMTIRSFRRKKDEE